MVLVLKKGATKEEIEQLAKKLNQIPSRKKLDEKILWCYSIERRSLGHSKEIKRCLGVGLCWIRCYFVPAGRG